MPLPDHIKIPLTDDRSVLLELIRIPAGDFLMGSRWGHSSEEPVHEVCIPFDFYLGQFPVTQQQFAVWTNATDLDHKNRFAGYDDNPAESMNWDESVQFCAWLGERYAHYQSKEETWPSDYQCALPSEAQWEYACSAWGEIENNAGSVNRVYTEYHSGDGEAALHQAGWYGNNSDSQTHAVGGKAPNRHGLYDMHGNVWEWCIDGRNDSAYRQRAGLTDDPLVLPARGDADRVVRGGSWGNHAFGCRVACRGWWHPGDRVRFQGFRVGLFPVQSCQTKQSVR